ncbi:MAG: 3-methyl-2-oxobutanoate dehydrogenase subunit VorB, partial [Tenericutes bacterium HGW-Tenericutes-7]
QADYFQATRGGGNGDYHVIVLAPESIQETVDIMKQAFDIADTYRNPVMVLVDGLIGQMMESVDLDKPIKKRHIEPKTYITNGTNYHEGRNIVNSLGLDPVYLEKHNFALKAKYDLVRKHEVQYEMVNMDHAEYVIVAYGTVARITRSALETLKKKNINVGLIRPISLWPYPKQAFDLIPKTCKGILVVEMSMGQMLDDVLISNKGRHKVAFYGRAGGMVPDPEEIVDAILHFDEKVVE